MGGWEPVIGATYATNSVVKFPRGNPSMLESLCRMLHILVVYLRSSVRISNTVNKHVCCPDFTYVKVCIRKLNLTLLSWEWLNLDSPIRLPDGEMQCVTPENYRLLQSPVVVCFTHMHPTLCIALGDIWLECSCLAIETHSMKLSAHCCIGASCLLDFIHLWRCK